MAPFLYSACLARVLRAPHRVVKCENVLTTNEPIWPSNPLAIIDITAADPDSV